jgi:hypothetical protein
MNAALMQRAEYRQYRGPVGIPDSTTRPYVFSEQVPADKIWLILAASAREVGGLAPTSLWLYAVPPNPSDVAAGNAVYFPVLRPGVFTGKIANQFNSPPLVAGVQLSKGGPGGVTKEMQIDNGSVNSVNFLLEWPVIVPPRWMLTVMQDANGGGGSNMQAILSVMILPLAIGEDLGKNKDLVKNNFVSFTTRRVAVGSGG